MVESETPFVVTCIFWQATEKVEHKKRIKKMRKKLEKQGEVFQTEGDRTGSATRSGPVSQRK